MNRRAFVKASGAGRVALFGAGIGLYALVPVIPRRPDPGLAAAAGWIAYEDGRCRLTIPRAGLGQNIATTLKQVACTELGVAWDAVDIALHDTARAAYDALRLPVHTGLWRGLGAGPNALATESALDEAARAAGADPLAFRLAHIRDPLLAKVLRRAADLSDWSGRPQSAQTGPTRLGRGLACGIYKGVSYAATVAEVAVDPDGTVRVTHLWCTHACGRVINPDQIKAQCEGNLIWSLGMVLSDHLPTERGRVTAEYFPDAPIPKLSDTPDITMSLIESTAPPTGAGETAIVSGPGAIANAIRAATGHRITAFPVRRAVLAA